VFDPSLPAPAEIPTLADERILVASHGDDAIRISVIDPYFGGIATVRIDADQAAELAEVLAAHSAARPPG
jgi:hypothetical protein